MKYTTLEHIARSTAASLYQVAQQKDSFSPILQVALQVVVKKYGLEAIPVFSERLLVHTKKIAHEEVVRVISRYPISTDTRASIDTLVKKYTPTIRSYRIEEHIDESILGGQIVYIGDTRIDYSVESQIASLTKR